MVVRRDQQLGVTVYIGGKQGVKKKETRLIFCRMWGYWWWL
jgi:hypothetical protein